MDVLWLGPVLQSMPFGVSVKSGLWTGLDYGLDWTMDWTGLDWTDQTAVYRQQTPPRLQKLVSSSASSCFLAVESSRHRQFSISERSKVTCIFNKLPQR